MVSLVAFQSSPRNFFLPLFYLSGGFLAQTLLPSLWLLMVRLVLETNNHDHHAGLRRALWLRAGCTNLPQTRGTILTIFSVSQVSLHYIYVYKENGFFLCCCCYFLPLTLLSKGYFPPLLLIPTIPPSVIPTPGIPSSLLLSARDSCHLGPIRSDWSSILQRQAHLICKALQLGL